MKKGLSIQCFVGHLYNEFNVKINQDTIYEWVKVHPEFSESKSIGTALSQMKYEQWANDAFEKGVKGFPSAPWVFTMKNKFKWRDDPHNEEASDDRPTIAELMESVYKDEQSRTKKKTGTKPKKRSRSSH